MNKPRAEQVLCWDCEKNYVLVAPWWKKSVVPLCWCCRALKAILRG